MLSPRKSGSEEKILKLPVTEIVDQDERVRYGPEGDIDKESAAKSSPIPTSMAQRQASYPPSPPQPGMVTKTGQLLSSVGSTLWSGATGAVSLSFGVLRSGVSAGSSAITGVANGVVGLVGLRSAPATETNATTNDNSSEQCSPAPPVESSVSSTAKSYLPKSLFRGSRKDKAD
ncbi:hypothetical protein AAHC03_09913 [Spirometra sp. Aus1]|nr:unnamed protein product [Spirometra erinaceieuropaei]